MVSIRLLGRLRARAVGFFCSTILGLVALSTTAKAQNLLQNGGFESSTFTSASATSGGFGFVNPTSDTRTATVPNWTWTADPVAGSSSTFGLSRAGAGETGTVVDGTLAVVFGAGSPNSGGSISQNFTPTAGSLYIANLWVSRIGAGQTISASVTVKNNLDGSTVATVPIDLSGVAAGQWKQVTFTFTAPSNNLSFTFTDTTPLGAADSTDMALDDISVQAASTQSSTILGGFGTTGTQSSNTEFTLDGGATWHPAYLVGSHPWGFIAGTNNWINQANNETTGLYSTTTYRVKFTAPAIMASPSMKFTINADNYGTMNINGHSLGETQGGPPSSPGVYPIVQVGGSYIVPGLNILTIDLRDTGGLVAMNFRIDLTAIAAQPITITPVGPDTTPPVISLPANQTLEATSPAGAVATFTATATDNVDGFVPVAFSPASGSTFPLGVTTVTATAHDNAGNIATGTFTVTVRDTTPPVLTLPGNLTAEATGPTGAIVTFAASANDAYSGNVPVTFTPSSGSTFAIGTTKVTAQATDSSGNVGTGQFTVTVRDTLPPVISVSTSADFSENFSGYTPGLGATNTQYQSGLTVGYLGDIPGWTKTGLHAVHAVDLSGHGNWAVMIWQDNVITSTRTTTDNASGADYVVRFNAGPAVDQDTSQLTTSTDGLLIQILRADNSVLSQFTYHPGAWTGAPALVPVSFQYTGDGSGAVHMSVGPSAPNSGHFGGTIDDISITPSTPADITLEATSSAGAVAIYTATASDLVSGAVPVTATSASGNTFALGTTLVTLSAVDSAQNHATASFKVIVRDTTPPTLTLPGNITAEATSASGATVNFAATSTDMASTPTISYSQNPGTLFPLGTTTVKVTATDGSNNTQTGSFTVTVKPAVATITLTTPNYTYDGTGKVATATTLPAGLPVTFSYDGGVALPISAGTHTVAAQVNQPWISGAATGTLVIGPATVSVTADTLSKVYGAADPALTYTVTGLQGSDTASGVLTGTLARAAGESVAAGPYAITQGLLAANGNYTISYTGSTLAITAAPLTVTAAPASKVYGSPDPALAFAITSGALVGTDTLGGTLARVGGENVGNYAINPGTLSAGSNYALSYVGATLAITPKPASVTPNAATKVYGAADPAFTGTLSGFLAADNVTAAYSRVSGETVAGGPYAISAAPIPSPVLGNYSISTGTAPFTITPAALAVSAVSQNKIYGSADPAFTYSVTGLQFTDTAGSVLTGALTRVGGETVNGGPYAIQVGTLAANSNYTLGYIASTLTIAPATAAVAVQGYSGVYDGKSHGATGTATGVSTANLASMLNLGASFVNVPGGTATWQFHDPAGNYNDAGGTVAITLTKAAPAVAVTGYSVIYDGNPHLATGGTTGVSGETLAAPDLSGTKHTSAGTFLDTWTFTDTTGNYNNATGTVTDTIGKAAAAIVVTPYSVIYDTKSHTATGTVTGVKGESLLAGLNLIGTMHTNAGSYSDTWTFTDAAGNYNTATAVITDQIAKATETIALAPLAQMYDGKPKPVTATTSPVSGLTVTITYNGSATAPTMPGSYAVAATIVDPNYAGTELDTLTIGVTALVRHGISLDGDIEGSLQVLLPENDTLNGNAGITGDLLVPGLPAVRLNGHPTFVGTQDGTGAASPTNYTVTLNGNALLRYLVRRTDALAMPTVAAPDLPTGTRSVSLNTATDPIGAWSTLKDLTLNGKVGDVTVPVGVYGSFTANGGSSFTLGVAGATTPSVYEFQSLTLNGKTALHVAGPVIIILKGDLNLNGNVGSSAHPAWLDLRVSTGGVTLNGNVTLYGTVTAPNGTVSINGNSVLTGGLSADKLLINGNGVLVQPSN